MAEKTDFDSRPGQISKDMQGSGPLSPQWLFPKSGENKTGIATGENHFNPHSVYPGGSEPPKSPGMGEDVHDHQKKKEVFRPSVMDVESARRDRWREEERDTNSSIRRDRWREGDKGLGDGRKVDRWTDSAGRHYGEGRRVPVERFSDSGNRESSHDQRRESKWNTRWGPDNKEVDGLREKWSDFSKDDDFPIEKGPSGLVYHGKDEREGDHYRPWRPNASQSRGRVDSPHHLTLTPNKHAFTASHGRGRGENAPTFSHGRGRIPSVGSSMNDVSSHIQSHSVLAEKVESGHDESSPLRYTRTKLLNVYSTTDMRSSSKYLEGVAQIPSLMQEEPLAPLAIGAPSAEELIVLKGIENGEVLSSGAPQINKDSSIGRNSTDFLQSRRNKQGSRNELLHGLDDSRDETIDNGRGGHSDGFYDRQLHSFESNAKVEAAQDYEKFSELKLNTEGVWRSPSIRERSHVASKEFLEIPGVVGSNIGWSGAQKGLADERERSISDSSYTKSEGLKWQLGNDPLLKRQHSAILDKELDKQKLPQASPEDFMLYYKDPQGEIQGPFSGSDIIGWLEAGYFGIDLLVRLVGAPPDTPFAQLGDVMPHLRAKARPPPGFGTPKPSTDASAEMNMNPFAMLHSGPTEIDISRSEQRYNHSSTADAENRFLESLMSGSTSNAPPEKFVHPEGMPGYIGNTAGTMPSVGSESGDNLYLLAKKIALERQRSLPNPYSYWPGRDVASIVPTSDVLHDSLPHSKLPLVADNARQQPHNQNVDLMSLLQGLPDRSASMNSGTSGWSNFPTQGGSENLQNRLDMHNGQRLNTQAAFGIQQPRLPAQNPPLMNFLGQTLDNPSSILAPEKLLSSGISQDPQMLNLLQQQYLLQLQTQTPLSPQQLLLLDKLLLLKQQQQKQEQQQLVLQQQQLLSQMLSEHHSSQHFPEPSYGQLQTGGIPTGNVTTDHAQLQPSRELLNLGTQSQLPARQEDRAPNFVLPTSISLDGSHSVGSEPSSIHLPHQVFGDYHQRSSGNYQEQLAVVQQRGSLISTGGIDPLPGMDTTNKYPLEHKSENIEPATVMSSVAAPSLSPPEGLATSVDLPPTTSHGSELTLDQQSEYVQPLPERHEKPQYEGGKNSSDSSSVKEVKNIESSVKDMKIVESSEVKKSTEKKSKKQKSAKMQAVDTANGVSKTKQLKLSESKEATVSDAKSDIHGGPTGVGVASEPETMERKNNKVAVDDVNVLGENLLHVNVAREGENDVTKGDPEQIGAVSPIRSQGVSGARAWKPSPGFKPKSLLEIQEEEQRRAQAEIVVTEITSQNPVNVSTPWAGVIASSADQKHLRETELDASSRELNLRKSDSSFNQKSKKSQLHDVLAENFVVKSSEREEVANSEPSLPAVPHTGFQADAGDDDAFIEAKDTKKSRKKSAKAKAAASRTSAPVASVEIPTGSSPIDKVKISRQVQMEKEMLPAVPSGPSLGDFVIWKGETANTSAAPAWSTDSGKTPKPTSLRDILKEQQKKGSTGPQHIPVPTPQKSVPTQPARGGTGSWSHTASSPSKAATPIQVNLQAASQSKTQVEDDFFWGPIDQPKQEAKQSDFPHLGNHGSWGVKNTPVKGSVGGSSNKQKSTGRPMERVMSSSPASAHSSLKGKKDFQTKHSEAMDFREWCESECARLIGSKDTSFLEFCLRQSRSEAETLLIENLGSFDPDHEFIEKFLNYKDFLPADVLEIAFQRQNDRKVTGKGAGDVTSDPVGIVEAGEGGNAGGALDVATKGGGKKKGKKGKKVNLSELGFNVVSNRIMMGEIQSIED
ncbi:protein ESSENTIAL FOR POTEXVIRUS ACCUMULATION 1-like [Ipomoea triloba]|uniref:protein ESSENTIAL FOR POTEXVIRUS ACCUMULATION 1-like n=1 Tax=Ipomoea triloba TaxID=35885 RepID=UPI00125D213A|nr:protein ESSENTIAL FOR POTEXVIRUS ACCUMULATION 1-like [Ipomoea triloba]